VTIVVETSCLTLAAGGEGRGEGVGLVEGGMRGVGIGRCTRLPSGAILSLGGALAATGRGILTEGREGLIRTAALGRTTFGATGS
jgi:hypothetical protein